MKNSSTLAMLLAVFGLLGCPPGERAAGPTEEEYGKTFFWGVVGSSSDVSDECTDADDWQDQLKPIEFSDNSFVIYRLAEDGSTATFQTCETTTVSTCSDHESPRVMTRNGSVYTHTTEIERSAVEGDETLMCEFTSKTVYTLTDNGESLDMQIDIEFGLEGDQDDCDSVEDLTILRSDNGKGIRGCSVNLGVEGDFRSAS